MTSTGTTSRAGTRVLLFHTGTHKTGSTALQTWLAKNQDRLAEAGVGYRFVEGPRRGAGNGQVLYHLVNDVGTGDEQLADLLEFYSAGQAVAVCSSEDFTRFSRREWEQVRRVCERLGFEVRTLTFVRDLGSYCLSLHREMTRRGLAVSLAAFCEADAWSPVRAPLECLLDTFGRDAMTVVHYESAIGRLDREFLTVLGLDPAAFDASPLARTINRSLTTHEQELVALLNQQTGAQYAEGLAHLLIARRPDLPESRQLAPEIVDQLRERHAQDVAWVNATFFDGRDVVEIARGMEDGTGTDELAPDDRQAIDRDVLEFLATQLRACQEGTYAFLRDRLQAIDWRRADDPRLPAGFDPAAYLLLNPDVLQAGVPPCQHYLDHGHHDEWRRWRWERP